MIIDWLYYAHRHTRKRTSCPQSVASVLHWEIKHTRIAVTHRHTAQYSDAHVKENFKADASRQQSKTVKLIIKHAKVNLSCISEFKEQTEREICI